MIDRTQKTFDGYRFAQGWAPPSSGNDDLDLTRESIHPALQIDQRLHQLKEKERLNYYQQPLLTKRQSSATRYEQPPRQRSPVRKQKKIFGMREARLEPRWANSASLPPPDRFSNGLVVVDDLEFRSADAALDDDSIDPSFDFGRKRLIKPRPPQFEPQSPPLSTEAASAKSLNPGGKAAIQKTNLFNLLSLPDDSSDDENEPQVRDVREESHIRIEREETRIVGEERHLEMTRRKVSPGLRQENNDSPTPEDLKLLRRELEELELRSISAEEVAAPAQSHDIAESFQLKDLERDLASLESNHQRIQQTTTTIERAEASVSASPQQQEQCTQTEQVESATEGSTATAPVPDVAALDSRLALFARAILHPDTRGRVLGTATIRLTTELSFSLIVHSNDTPLFLLELVECGYPAYIEAYIKRLGGREAALEKFSAMKARFECEL